MKLFLLTTAVLIFTMNCLITNDKINKNQVVSHGYTDSTMFKHHYKILNTIINKNPYDTSIICIKSVSYMERFTGIKAHTDGNYFGWYSFTKQDLVAWDNFYKKYNHNKANNLTKKY